MLPRPTSVKAVMVLDIPVTLFMNEEEWVFCEYNQETVQRWNVKRMEVGAMVCSSDRPDEARLAGYEPMTVEFWPESDRDEVITVYFEVTDHFVPKTFLIWIMMASQHLNDVITVRKEVETMVDVLNIIETHHPGLYEPHEIVEACRDSEFWTMVEGGHRNEIPDGTYCTGPMDQHQ